MINGGAINSFAINAASVQAAVGNLSVNLPLFDFTANGGTLVPNTLTVTLATPILSAVGGGELSASMLPTFTANGYAEDWGNISAEMPLTFSANGYLAVDSSFAISMPFAFSANGGGELNVTTSAFTISASGIVGSVGELSIIVPNFTFVASGNTTSTIGTLAVQMPFLVANYGSLYAEMALDFKAWTAPVQNSLTAYAMNIKNAETTTYSNFDFKFIMRLGFDYYGVKDDGLYLLGGVTDNGTSIAASVKTAQNMFGTNLRKRSPKIYLDTENTVAIKPIIDTVEGDYTYESDFGGRKVSLGRGYEGKIWEFELSKVYDEDWRVGAMEVQLDVLSRRI